MRKVMGASEANLVYMLSKEFLVLLLVALLLALPAAYFLFSRVILTSMAYPAPIITLEWVAGIAAVVCLAFLTIGSLTFKTAQSNPTEVLKNE
jgi:ABC-type antimicrobial peptide transport system permease subunit